MSIRHVLFSERDNLIELHPELLCQYPKFVTPYLADAIDYPADFPYVFYALEDGVVASYLNAFPDILFREKQQYRWAWNANLFTNPNFRGRGLAQKIIEHQLTEFAKRGFVWGGTFSSDPALRLYRKLGFKVVGAAARMCLLRNPAPFLRHHLSSRALVRFLSSTYWLGYRSAKLILFRQKSFKKNYSIEQIGFAALAKLLDEHPRQYGDRAHWSDDAALLRAKMNARNSDQIALVRDSSARPLLFFLWRVRDTAERPIKERYSGVSMFSVMEFGYLQAEASQDALIRAAIALFDETSADLLEIITSPPELENAARRHGFVALGSGMSFTFKAPKGHPLDHVKTAVADWDLTHYSGDGYSFE
ncbi:MAG TPA: GNAT family N-acetyltransferase [Sphingomicrobium sp.]|nr:GNAT family N-acetyltransferase [Sphingomicrobium sp.]